MAEISEKTKRSNDDDILTLKQQLNALRRQGISTGNKLSTLNSVSKNWGVIETNLNEGHLQIISELKSNRNVNIPYELNSEVSSINILSAGTKNLSFASLALSLTLTTSNLIIGGKYDSRRNWVCLLYTSPSPRD